jgi:hypothetical protein
MADRTLLREGGAVSGLYSENLSGLPDDPQNASDVSRTAEASPGVVSDSPTKEVTDSGHELSSKIKIHVERQDGLSGRYVSKQESPAVAAELIQGLLQGTQHDGLSVEQELQGLKDFVAAIAKAARDANDEFPKVVRQAKEILGLINDNIQSGTLGQVEATELELFAHRIVLGTIQLVGDEQLVLVVQEILRDRSTWETLRQMAEIAPQLSAVANQVTDEIVPAGHPSHDWLSPLVLGGAVILLAASAGVILPLLAGSIAETILANEVAIAAVAVGAAALIKRS